MGDTFYGIAQGLNTAYHSYRGREREIEDKGRRAFRDELLEKAEVRAENQDERDAAREARQAEQHQYGITRREAAEQAATTQQQSADLALQMQQTTYDEYIKNSAHRAEQNQLALDQAKEQLRLTGLQIDEADISLRGKKGAEKYNQWTREWLQGEDIGSLVKKFNTDEDDSNNIVSATGDENNGYRVEFENGREMEFADRDQVAIHLQSMADHNFHQTYLLQMESQKDALAEAIKKGSTKTADTMSREKKDWENMTRNQVKDYFTDSIKESIVSLGSEGDRDIAGDIRATVDKIGAASNYGMVNSDVTRVAKQLANNLLIKEPAERKRMAVEYIEELRDKGGAIPEEGTKEYELVVNRQMAEDYDRDYQNYERAVYSKFFYQDQDGMIQSRNPRVIADFAKAADPKREEKGDTITTVGLDRPEGDDKPDATAATGLPDRPKKDVMPVDRPTKGDTKIVLSGDSLIKEKRKEYGISVRHRNPSLNKSQKKKLSRDFDESFADMTHSQQGAWYREFGKFLDPERKNIAEQTLNPGKTLAGN